MIDQVSRELGPIDVLVNNAGLSVWQYMVNVDQESWDKMIDINIRGSLNCIAAVLPGMVERKKGYIINMSSIRGVTTGTGGAVYCGTKHFLEGLSGGLRAEVIPQYSLCIKAKELLGRSILQKSNYQVAGSGVRVSTVQPSLVDTNLITSNLAGKLSSLSYSNLLVRQKLFQLCLPFASQARTLLLWRNVRLPWREWPETSSTLKTSREPFSSCLNSPSIFPSQVFLCTHVLSNSNKSLLSSSPLTIVKV